MEATEDIYVLALQKNKYPAKNAEAKHQPVLHCMNIKCRNAAICVGQAPAMHVLNQPALKDVSWYWQKKKRGFDNTAAELLLFYSQTQMYEYKWDHIIFYTYCDT